MRAPLALSFAEPTFLLALLLVPLALLAYLGARRRARRYAVRFTAVPTLALATGSTRSWRRHLPAALALAAIGALALALAKPQRTVAIAVERASIVLVTDHSRSMLATDVEPDRLTAAQRAAAAFIDDLPDGVRVGVVAFSDGPDIVHPPSLDHDTARRLIDAQIADGGTATGDALQVALDTLGRERRGTERPPAAIILLSDGKTTLGSDPLEAARRAARLDVPIYTVALGTREATVPNPGFGPPLPVAPDPETLRRIASISGGRAFAARDADRLSSIYRSLGSQLGSRRERREVTGAFAVGGLVLLAAALALSLRSSGRLP